MRNYFVFIIAILSVCFDARGAGLGPTEIKKIKDGILRSDLLFVTAVLSESDNPFKCQKQGLGKLFDNTPSHYCPSEKSGQELLKQSFKEKPCRDDIAVELLKVGARYDFGARYSTELLMKEAYESFCQRTVEYILKIGSEDEVLSASIKFFAFYEEKVKASISSAKEGYDSGREDLTALRPIKDMLQKFVIQKCPDSVKATAACSSREAYEGMTSRIEKALQGAEKYAKDEEAKEAFANTPDGLKATACEIDRQIAEAQAEIDRQKEIGKVSGTVNIVILNRNGARIVDLRTDRRNLEKRYSEVTKTSLPKGGCP